jgi:predicted small secreted protein
MQGVKLADKTEIRIPARLVQGDAIQFIRYMLDQYDLSELSEIKVVHKGYDRRHPVPQSWGNTRVPNPFKKTHKARYTYRISAMVRGEDADCGWLTEDFPRIPTPPRKYGFRLHEGQRYASIAELMVHIIGHEMYHFLCRTKQLPHNWLDERLAEKHGDDWVKLYREWRNARV